MMLAYPPSTRVERRDMQTLRQRKDFAQILPLVMWIPTKSFAVGAHKFRKERLRVEQLWLRVYLFMVQKALAVMMPILETLVRTPQQRRRYILKQDVARYGPTPECEACTTLAARAQRVTKPHSDECRARMEELMQRDEDALVHTDKLRRGSTVVEASEDERRNPDVEMTDRV